MTTPEIIIRLLEAAALGALIGIEREVVHNHIDPDKQRSQAIFGGLRSYTLISLLGAISVYLGNAMEFTAGMVVFVGSILTLFILLSYIYSAFQKQQFGVTSEFAALTVFLLGTMVMVGEVQIAIFIGIFLAIMLNYKSTLAPLISHIDREEISTTLKFAVIALIILPLLPDQKYSLAHMMVFLPESPFTTAAFFNPHSIWFFVVVMSAVSYVGYILTKLIGSKNGIILSGALGGLVSSTAVTSTMSEKSRHSDIALTYPIVIATISACSIMLFRVLGIVILFNAKLLETLMLPMLAMIMTSAGLLWWLWQKSKIHTSHVEIEGAKESPFSIIPALKFAGLVVVIKFFATFALVYRGEIGVLTDVFANWLPALSGFFHNLPIYIVALFSGLADVDAITQEMAELSNGSGLAPLSTIAAATAILVAITTNTAVKIGIARKFGSKRFGDFVMRILSAVLASGFLMLIIVAWVG